MGVQNITDVEDKIIKSARQNYVFERYISRSKSDKILKDIQSAFKFMNLEYENNLKKLKEKLRKAKLRHSQKTLIKQLMELKLKFKSTLIDEKNFLIVTTSLI